MWVKIKNFYNLSFRVFLAVALILLMLVVFLTLAIDDLRQDTQVLSVISLLMAIFSLPGIINQFVDEYNPKKKIYKLTCKCPKCKHLIEMDMKEE